MNRGVGPDKRTRSAERTLQILNAFSADRQVLGLSEIPGLPIVTPGCAALLLPL